MPAMPAKQAKLAKQPMQLRQPSHSSQPQPSSDKQAGQASKPAHPAKPAQPAPSRRPFWRKVAVENCWRKSLQPTQAQPFGLHFSAFGRPSAHFGDLWLTLGIRLAPFRPFWIPYGVHFRPFGPKSGSQTVLLGHLPLQHSFWTGVYKMFNVFMHLNLRSP